MSHAQPSQLEPGLQWQAHWESSTTKAQGSGMGLAISKSIVESHAGRIWADSGSECGAAFHLTLPVAPEETNPPVDVA